MTRLHLRYTRETFPEDLMFHQTSDRKNFQARYVLRHPWKGSPDKCKKAESYFRDLKQKQQREASQLAHLTGWDINDIRKKTGDDSEMNKPSKKKDDDNKKWWNKLWDN